MSEYEDRYPDAYGRHEETDQKPRRRHFFSLGLPRQVRDSESPLAEQRRDAPPVVNLQEPSRAPLAQRPPQPRHAERPRHPLVERSPQEIRDDVAGRLASNAFIDTSGISVTVDGSEVTLDGTINSLIAISLAKALASNVAGVGRVQVQLRVQPTSRPYETASGPGRPNE